MLARRLDHATIEEQQYTIEEVQVRQPQKKSSSSNLLQRRICVVMAVLLSTYLYSVWRSADQVRFGNDIIALQTQELHLPHLKETLLIFLISLLKQV